MSESDEEAVISETGGIKGQKIARFDLIPPGPLRALAEHFGRGARKYAPRNWEKGYQWSLSYAALQRHLNAFWDGEDYDQETGSHHLDAAMFHVMALREFVEKQQRFDDRPGKSEMQLAKEFSETFGEKATGRKSASETSSSEQAPDIGRERPVQTRRWQIP